jgi:hypothetical protein
MAQKLFSSHLSAPNLLITIHCSYHLLKSVREVKVIFKKPASLLLINHCSLRPEILLRDLSCVVVRLGEFHLLMPFMGCIGAIMAGSCSKALFTSMTIYTNHRPGQDAEWSCLFTSCTSTILTNLILAGIILDEVDLTGKERAETENKLREGERSLILFVKENRTYQSLRAKFKTALHNLEGNQSCGTNIFTRLLP